MFPDIGGTELLIVAVVALLVFKPEDLPGIMKKVGQFVGNAKRMAADFRSSFDDMARQSELDDLRKEVEAMRNQATKMMSDPVSGLADAMTETSSEIESSLASHPPDVDDGWPTSPTVEPAPAPAPKAKTAAKAPANPRAAKKPKPKDIVT